MKEMRKSLLIIKTTDSQTEVKQFKSFRLHKSKGDFYKKWKLCRSETKSSLGLNFW